MAIMKLKMFGGRQERNRRKTEIRAEHGRKDKAKW